jgi:hypothetical protein
MRFKNRNESIAGLINLGYEIIGEYKDQQHLTTLIDKEGYKYLILPSSVLQGSKPYIVADSNIYSFDNIKKWIKDHNKPFALKEENDFTKYEDNRTKLIFYCFRCESDFLLSWQDIVRGCGCSSCNKHLLTFNIVNDFINDNGNGDSLVDRKMKGKKLYLIINCHLCKRNYRVNWNRFYWGRRCPICTHVPGIISKRQNIEKEKRGIDITHPNYKLYWIFEKNIDVNPSQYMSGSKQRVWWRCLNGHPDYYREIRNTLKVDFRCPLCGDILCMENKFKHLKENKKTFLYTHPDLALEWSSLNGDKFPEDYMYGSEEKIWWICPEGHSDYLASINSRTSTKSGCPICSKSKFELRIRKFLQNNQNEFDKWDEEYKIKECKDINVLPFDFAIWKNNVLILCEANGLQHYQVCEFFGGEEKFLWLQKHDEIKRNFCKDNNIKLIVIPYWEINNTEKILTEELNLKNKEDLNIG